MKNKLVVALAVFLASFQFLSCDDFFEKDLKDSWVYGISPEDFSISTALTQTFKWKKVKGAESYNLQIYKTDKDFTTIKEFVADTNVKGTQYTQTLKSGYYRWQIYAQNAGSHSGLSVFRFQIDSTSDITNQKVVLLYPKDNKISDSLDQNFSWSPLSSAKQYNLQIYESGNNTAIYSELLSLPGKTFRFKKMGTYRWRVAALNGNLSSPFSEFTLTVDTTHPNVPVVISPKNDTSSIRTNPIVFKWNGVAGATKYLMEVAQDTASLARDTTAVLDGKILTQTYYGTAVSKKYYWRIKTIKGTTEGVFSGWWFFRRNP